MRTLLLLLTIFAFSTIVKAQSYIYQYVDPCTKNVKFVSVPLNGANIAVTYYGQVGTFSSADFSNGNFVAWLNQTSGANAGKPCDQATTQAVNSTNLIVTNNIISTLTNITSVSMMSASLASNVASASSTVGGNLGNTVNNGSSGDGSGNGSSSSGNKKNNNRNGNSGGNSNNNSNSSSGSTGNNQSSGSGQGSNSSSAGSTNSQGNGSSTNNGGTSTGSGGNNGSGNTGSGSGSGQGGGSTSSGSGGSGSGSSGSTEGGGSSTQPPVGNTGSTGSTGTGGNGNTNGGGTGSAGGTGNTTESGGLTQSNSSGGNGGTTNSVSNAAEATSSGGSSGGSGGSSKNGDKNRARTGALIGTGDIVAVRSAEEGEKDQFRFTMSMTKSNTKNTFARGFLGNFTTQINNSNITFYGAWTLPKSKTTIIAANSSMINPARDFFNTTTLLASKRFTKLSLMGGLNFTAGAIGETGFQNLSAVGGGFYMFNAGKKITGTLLVLGVYSPFTQFYEGNWWSSGLLVVPFSSWDYSVTKKFKFNISFSGTYEMNKNMLNYQVLTGGKVML
jgi:hypothetical protein